MSLLEVKNLTVRHPDRAGRRPRNEVAAVEEVSFSIMPGERLGLVGESGCGKSSLCRTLLGLHPINGGSIIWDGVPRKSKPPSLRRRRRAPDIQMVFQDPGGSLNPRMRAGQLLDEALWLHGVRQAAERRSLVVGLLNRVGLEAAILERYPHTLSGGQRQRLALARVLAAKPRLLIADEPVSALDVCVQSQILEVLLDLQAEHGFALLFVAHDLAIVRLMCHRALVMYSGRLVEAGPVETLFSRPFHPYTRRLLDAVPDVTRALQRRGRGLGRHPEPQTRNRNQNAGCAFEPHCPRAAPICRIKPPPWRLTAPQHTTACHCAAADRANGGEPTDIVRDKAGWPAPAGR